MHVHLHNKKASHSITQMLAALRTGRVDAVLAHVRAAGSLEAEDTDALVTALAYACPADVLLPALVAEFPDLRLPPAALAARRFDRGGTLLDYFTDAPEVGDRAAILRALARLGFH